MGDIMAGENQEMIEQELETETPDQDFDTGDIKPATADDGMVDSRRQYYVYEQCSKYPVRGMLLREVLLNPRTVGNTRKTNAKGEVTEFERPNVSFEVLLLQPTKAFAKRKNTGGPILYNAHAGTKILLPAIGALGEMKDKLASLPNRVFDFFLQMGEKVDHPTVPGQKLWRLKLKWGTSVARESRPEFAATIGLPLLWEEQVPRSAREKLGLDIPGGDAFPFGNNAAPAMGMGGSAAAPQLPARS